MQNYFVFLPIVSAVLCFMLALFTLSRNYRHPTNLGMALGLACLVVIESGNAMVLFPGGDAELALKGIRLGLIGESLMPITWYVFTTTFARANYKEAFSRWTPFMVGMAVVSLFFCVNAWSTKFVMPPVRDAESIFFFIGPLGKSFYIYLIIGSVMNLVQLENTFRSSTGVQRWQIKYVIFGIGAILAFFIYKASQTLLFSSLNLEIIPVMSTVTLISVSMVSLFIVRHRLLEADIFISRYVVYNSLTILIIGSYLLAMGVVIQGIKYFDIPFSYFFSTLFIFIAVLALFVVLFIASLRRRVQMFINRHFYKHKYEFRDKWMESIEKISPKSSIDEINGTIVEMISETMGARPVTLWLFDHVTKNYFQTGSGNANKRKSLGHNHPLVANMRKLKDPFIIEDLFDNETEENIVEIDALASETGALLCSPLLAGEDLVGFVLQGGDFSGEEYRQDDFEFLKAVTTQAAVQIKNIRMADDLIAAKEMDMFSKMSSFIMHDLKNLTNSLSLLSQNAKSNIDNPEFQKDAMSTIEQTVKRMKGLIEKLSAVQYGFKMNKEVVDLNEPIAGAMKKIVFPEGKEVVITKRIADEIAVSIDPEAIEMVLVNLFSNAYEAIESKGLIDISAHIDGGNVIINISDDGAGMSSEYVEKSLFKPFRSTKKTGFGIGLYQCKTVVESHGGAMSVKSEEGRGTTFTLSLPLHRVQDA